MTDVDGEEPGTLMAGEIADQPRVLASMLARAAEFRAVADAISLRRPRFVLITARGTSDHAALYGKYLAEIELGLPAGLVSPSSMTLYGARPDLADVLFVAVSQSGASPDLAESLAVARECGAMTVSVTNVEGSELDRAAEFPVRLGAGAERSVAATKTYTAQLLALYLLLARGADGDPASAAAALPDAAAATLANAERVYAAAARYRFATRLVTTGRGYSYPTAREGALKLMETCYVSAHAFSCADLLHGPFAMLDQGVPVIAVASPGRGGDAAVPVIQRLRGTGADVLEVGVGVGETGLAVESAGLAERLLPILEIMPLQQLAWRLAMDKGGDPDRPRGLSKVTMTR
jgi:glutamine---fructose-6-phosphate transaminase (isomerizing)